jgi:hypothetical protein
MDMPNNRLFPRLFAGGLQASFGGLVVSVDLWIGLAIVAAMAIMNAVLYMLKPTARVVRRAWAQQVAVRMHTTYQDSDEG